MRSKQILVAVVASAVAFAGACSGGGDEGASDGGDRVDATGDLTGIDRRAAGVVTDYFDALARGDLDRAASKATGAAAELVTWTREVDDLGAESGLRRPEGDVPPSRASLGPIGDSSSGVLEPTGHVLLGARPAALAEGDSDVRLVASGGPEAIATDVVLTGEGEDLRISDYRLDDSPYPVSQLFVSDPAPATAVVVGQTSRPAMTIPGSDGVAEGSAEHLAASIQVHRAHRDLDRSVEYVLTVGATRLVLVDGSRLPGATTSPSPQIGAIGDPVRFDGAESGAAEEEHRVLAVVAGAFPGTAGVLRLTFDDPSAARDVLIDVEVRGFPELTPKPTNTVRASLAEDVATTTSEPGRDAEVASATQSRDRDRGRKRDRDRERDRDRDRDRRPPPEEEQPAPSFLPFILWFLQPDPPAQTPSPAPDPSPPRPSPPRPTTPPPTNPPPTTTPPTTAPPTTAPPTTAPPTTAPPTTAPPTTTEPPPTTEPPTTTEPTTTREPVFDIPWWPVAQRR